MDIPTYIIILCICTHLIHNITHFMHYNEDATDPFYGKHVFVCRHIGCIQNEQYVDKCHSFDTVQ